MTHDSSLPHAALVSEESSRICCCPARPGGWLALSGVTVGQAAAVAAAYERAGCVRMQYWGDLQGGVWALVVGQKA